MKDKLPYIIIIASIILIVGDLLTLEKIDRGDYLRLLSITLIIISMIITIQNNRNRKNKD